jgi:hypothetical protein
VSENWQPDDLALCIHDGSWWDAKGKIIPGPAFGMIRTVVDVTTIHDDLVLKFEDWEAAFEACCFLKVTPPAADEFDREVIAQMIGQPEQVPA